MHCLFVSVYFGSQRRRRLPCMLPIFRFCAVISEIPSCLLLLARNSPSAGCISAASHMWKGVDILMETDWFFKTNPELQRVARTKLSYFLLASVLFVDFATVFLFCLFSILFLCICCLFRFCPVLIYVCMLCCFCNWPFGCRLDTLRNK